MKKQQQDDKKTLEDEVLSDVETRPYHETTELAEAMQNLDNDEVDPQTKMSKVDFNSRLTDTEIPCLMVIDELKQLGIFPANALISTQKKRLSVSLSGLGRSEKVDMAIGHKEQVQKKGILAGFFNRKDEPQKQ